MHRNQSVPKANEVRWGKRYSSYSVRPNSSAFDLLIDEAVRHGYLSSGNQLTGYMNMAKVVKLDRFCRKVLNAELIIGDSTGNINGIRFNDENDCTMFKLRVG